MENSAVPNNSEGHTSYSCNIKKCAKKGVKTIWVPNKIITNTQGPNKIWVPKTNGLSFLCRCT